MGAIMVYYQAAQKRRQRKRWAARAVQPVEAVSSPSEGVAVVDLTQDKAPLNEDDSEASEGSQE